MGQESRENQVAAYHVLKSAQDLARRVAEGSLSEQFVIASLDRLKTGQEIRPPRKLLTQVAAPPNDEGLIRLTLEPKKPMGQWREELGIEPRDWNKDLEKHWATPEPWETGLVEVLFGYVAPGKKVGALRAINLLTGRDLHGTTIRMQLALAKANRMLAVEASMVALGSTLQSFLDVFGMPFVGQVDGRLSADVYWHEGTKLNTDCRYGGFRRF